MKTIQLTQGKVALVDDEDYELLCKFKWYAVYDGNNWYAQRLDYSKETKKRNCIPIHRFVMKAEKGQIIDHKNGNGLDCQKHNLRISTRSQNGANRKSAKNSTSKYLGVSLKIDKRSNYSRWRAGITHNKKNIHIGLFNNEENAATAYNIFAEKYHGDFAKFNVPI